MAPTYGSKKKGCAADIVPFISPTVWTLKKKLGYLDVPII
jgi:hypothetical protein